MESSAGNHPALKSIVTILIIVLFVTPSNTTDNWVSRVTVQITCSPMTHWPALTFSVSKCLACLSAYFTPISIFVSIPLVFALKKNVKKKLKINHTLVSRDLLPFSVDFNRFFCVCSPCWLARAAWSGLGSCFRFQRCHWPRRCHSASGHRPGWLWWNSQGFPAAETETRQTGSWAALEVNKRAEIVRRGFQNLSYLVPV